MAAEMERTLVSSTALTGHTWHAETSSRGKKTSEVDIIMLRRRTELMKRAPIYHTI